MRSILFSVFTFQYASIKRKVDPETKIEIDHLHFNMLLLNIARSLSPTPLVVFTFQYASIKPCLASNPEIHLRNLHFNMLLLNEILLKLLVKLLRIYISICFY